MGVTIRQIYIENFRSIQRLTVPTGYLSVFVGKNDSGKSNILRALNLFFNDVTSPGRGLVFGEDYNLFVPVRQKKSKKIVVRLELDIPKSYQQTNGNIIVWEKTWQENGSFYEDYYGCRLSWNRRGRELREIVKIPEKSNVHALLRQIEFEYVPAIRDAHYFDDLRGRIYNTIAEVATRTFQNSSTAFEESIGDHLADLTKDIGLELGFETRLALPRDLTHIFQRLDFLSGAKSIPLDYRGDGIKTRHIPLILGFMADKKRLLQGKGSAPYSFIWAYEEPENNLEFASAVELATQLFGFARKGMAQILLTTHSPIFYDLASENEETTCSHVFRDTDDKGTELSDSACDVDEKMGTMALLAPRVKDLVRDIQQQADARVVAERLAHENRTKIFVEGESDRIVLDRCVQVFLPERAGLIDFETKPQGGGHTYVIDMLNGWRSYHKHHPDGPKAAGLVDQDAAQQKVNWNRGEGNTASAKCFCYPKPPHAKAALAAGFNLAVTLEVLYSQAVWDWAEGRGMLEDRSRSDMFPQRLIEEILKGQVGDYVIDEKYVTYVTKEFALGSKVAAARYVERLDDDQIRADFMELGGVLREIFDYLAPVEARIAAE